MRMPFSTPARLLTGTERRPRGASAPGAGGAGGAGDAAVAGAGGAGVRDDRAVPLAGGAGAARDDLAQEGALDALHLAAAAARLAGGQVGAGRGAGAGALGAQHGGVDRDRRLDAERRLHQVELEAQDRVGAGPGARPGATALAARRGAEEGVHDVLEADERAAGTARAGTA